MTALAIGTRVMIHTEDTFDGIFGEVISVFPDSSRDDADPDDYKYRVQFIGPNSGLVLDAPFRPSELMIVRDQPMTNHGAF